MNIESETVTASPKRVFTPLGLKRAKRDHLVVALLEEVNVLLKKQPLTVDDLMCQSRRRLHARPRQVLMNLLCDYLHFSSVGVGAFLGGRDHSTIICGKNLIRRRIERDPLFAGFILRIKARFIARCIDSGITYESLEEVAIPIEPIRKAVLWGEWQDSTYPLRTKG